MSPEHRTVEEKLPADLLFLQWLIDECGYKYPKPIGEGRWAAIIPKMFTHAIAVGRIDDFQGIDAHWCYETLAAARVALDAWDGRGEPNGWFRNPDSGRRISRSPDEIDENGQAVGAVGVLYVRI